MKRSGYCLFLLALAATTGAVSATAQVFTNNGAAVTITSGSSITVKGDLTNATNATITNNGTLSVSGNTVNNGMVTAPSGSTLRLEGTTAQTLSGASPVSAKDVVVNNAAGITLATPLNIDGVVTFTSGILTATNAAYPVVFSANASISGTPTNGSHVDGYVRKLGTGTFTFPVGNATTYQPVGMNLSANNTGLTARYFAADGGGTIAAPLVAYNKREYWDLTPVSTATGTVTIYFDGYNNTGIGNTADLRVAHQTGGQWVSEGGSATGTTGNGSVTSGSVSTFSPFTLGSVSASSPLPLSLLAFEGSAEGNGNRLRWQVIPETIIRVAVERLNAQNGFDGVGEIVCQPRTTDYTFYDDAVAGPEQHYRLRLTTTGGAISYSQTINIRHGAIPEGGALSVYPSPTTNQLTVAVAQTNWLGTTATVQDIQGRDVLRFALQATQTLDVQGWPAGLYLLRLADGTTTKIIKQ